MPMKGSKWVEDLCAIWPSSVQQALSRVDGRALERVDELRLRARKPLMVQLGSEDYYLCADGSIHRAPRFPLVLNEGDITATLERACDHSLYAHEQALRQGYLTLRGGYRVGLAGQVVHRGGEVLSIPYCSGLCVRMMRELVGCADWLMPMITTPQGALSTLIVSPPMMGKTTLLRDIARQISDGMFGKKGQKVCIVDERSELGGCVFGVAQLDVGLRTDVLDACPKAKGISMALRTLSPHVIVTDELGDIDDAQAVLEASYAGVKVIATVHGNDDVDISRRSAMAMLLERRAFERIVVLGESPGRILKVTDEHQSALWARRAS